jgi:hypothetical protein
MKAIINPISYRQLISIGARIALFGFVTSGPVAFAIVSLVKPQPAWTSSAVFAENYALVQNLPYYFGFFLVAGMFMIVAGHFLNYSGGSDEVRFRLLLALGATTIFCVLISFNYICQSTFVANLATGYKPEYESAVFIFSMSNPLSLCWAIEMWGYGLLGIGTWLMAACYSGRNAWIEKLLIVNGSVSVIGAIWVSIDISWVMTPIGLIAYLGWNVLMMVVLVLMYRDSKKLSKVHI